MSFTKLFKGLDQGFSQWETVNRILFYQNNEFETGKTDREGLTKKFIDIISHRRDTSKKMIDVDVKDIKFIPDDGAEWLAWLMAKDFKDWAKKNEFGTIINELEDDFVSFGTCVSKKMGTTVERVPLKFLRNQQDALSLEDADFVIEEHEYSPTQFRKVAKEMDWDIKGVKLGEDPIKVFERYGEVTAADMKRYQKKAVRTGDEDTYVETMSILTLIPSMKDKEANGSILFLAETDSRPYREAHWKKVDGRWLGRGVYEDLFENQESANELANFRRRAVLWSSKKVFQSPDEGLPKNILTNVSDGHILRTSPNGQITQVDMSTRALAEYSNDEQVWNVNADKKTFTFEVATGEALPSGTPFRLGAVLTQSVQNYFDLKRETFGLFLKKLLNEIIVPSFKKNTKEHIVSLTGNEAGLDRLKELLVETYTYQSVMRNLPSGDLLPDVEQIKQRIRQELESRQMYSIKIPKDLYKGREDSVDIEVTGESVDISSKMETFKTLLQIVMSNPQAIQDPNVKRILEKIMALNGESFNAIISSVPMQIQPQGIGSPAASQAGFEVPQAQPAPL